MFFKIVATFVVINLIVLNVFTGVILSQLDKRLGRALVINIERQNNYNYENKAKALDKEANNQFKREFYPEKGFKTLPALPFLEPKILDPKIHRFDEEAPRFKKHIQEDDLFEELKPEEKGIINQLQEKYIPRAYYEEEDFKTSKKDDFLSHSFKQEQEKKENEEFINQLKMDELQRNFRENDRQRLNTFKDYKDFNKAYDSLEEYKQSPYFSNKMKYDSLEEEYKNSNYFNNRMKRPSPEELEKEREFIKKWIEEEERNNKIKTQELSDEYYERKLGLERNDARNEFQRNQRTRQANPYEEQGLDVYFKDSYSNPHALDNNDLDPKPSQEEYEILLRGRGYRE